jgi:hypothetical protein
MMAKRVRRRFVLENTFRSARVIFWFLLTNEWWGWRGMGRRGYGKP